MCDDVPIGTLMATYVYEYFPGKPDSIQRRLEVYTSAPANRLTGSIGDYWYPYPSSGTLAFWVQGDYIYEPPPSGPPKYYTP